MSPRPSIFAAIGILLKAALVLSPPLAQAQSGLLPYLRNSGFEEIDSAGRPAHWGIFRDAAFDQEPSLARSGSVSVRSSATYGWSQELLPPCSPYQTFAVAGFAACEFDFEQPRTRASFFSFSNQHLRDSNDSSPVAPAPGYQPFWTFHEVPAQTGRLLIYLAGRQGPSWPRFDDLRLFTEQFQTSGSLIGEPWSLTGATETNGALLLSNGSTTAQRVAAGRKNQAYFVAGTFAATAETTLTIEETWLPRADSETTASSSAMIHLPIGEGTFLADLPRPSLPSTGQALVTLRTETPGMVSLSELKRGFAKAEPTTLTLGGASPDTPLRLTAAWLDPLSTASVTILTEMGGFVAAPEVTLHGASLTASWSDSAAPAGNYLARFHLQSEEGTTLEVDRPFAVVRGDNLPATVAPLLRSSFTRCAWIYVIQSSDVAYIDNAIRLARDDGYNFATIACRPDQFADVRAAAERESLPYFIQSVEASSLFVEFLNRDDFGRAEYTSSLRDLYAPFLSSPLFQGVYVFDEPNSPAAWTLTSRAGRAIAQDDQLGLPFSVLVDRISTPTLATFEAPVLMVDQYPFRSENIPDNSAALLEILPRMNDYARTAAETGRHYWLVSQSFWAYEGGNFRPVPPSMHRAQLGAAVLAGAKGIVPFTYLTISYIEGQRDPDLNPTFMHAPYREFNALMDRLGSLIMSFTVPELDTRAPVPFAVSTATSSADGDRYLIAVNTDDTLTRTLSVTLTSPVAAPFTDLVSQLPLPPAADGSLPLQLGPGEWALVNIGAAHLLHFSQSVSPALSIPALDLPLLYQFTVRYTNGTAAAVAALSFHPDLTALAASTLWQFGLGRSHVYRFYPGGVVQEEPTPLLIIPERRFFLDDGSVAVASPELGFRIYPSGNITNPPLTEWIGYSGGTYNLARSAAGDYWMTLAHFGIRRAHQTPTGIESLASAPSNADAFRDLFGPLPSGSVLVNVRNTGIDRVDPGALDPELHERVAIRHNQENAALNSRGQLAVPRGPHGVALVQLKENGTLQWISSLATEAAESIAVAWVTDDVLAVADGIEGIRFYRLRSPFAPSFLGLWRPRASGPFYLRTLTSRGGYLAAGLQDGRVYVLDARPAATTAADADWQLYE